MTPLARNLDPTPGGPGALERLQARFQLTFADFTMGEVSLRLPELDDPLTYIDQCLRQGNGDAHDLPFWTKVWPGALAMASLAARLPAGTRVLELGAGLGLPGLVAAAHGAQVVVTDLFDDCLEFARAAAEVNGLGDRVEVRRLDWTAPEAGLGSYQVVLGAEILYRAKLFAPLAGVLDQVVAPGGRALLAQQKGPRAAAFFELVQRRFEVRAARRLVPGEDEPVEVFLYNLARKLDIQGR